MMLRNGVIFAVCGGDMDEDQITGVNVCELCGIKLYPDGTVDRTDCETEE